MFGLHSPLYFQEKEVAAKTGTTQEYRDAWTIGYTPSIVVGVWVGNNNNLPTFKKPGVVLAGPIFHSFMEEALKNFPSQNFEKPENASTTKPVLNGQIGKGNHSILYYVNKNDPLGPNPQDPSQDIQFKNWEEGIKRWLLLHPEFKT